MEKETNILQAHIETVGDAIHDALAEKFDKKFENAKVTSEYEAYGDTYAETQRYIDDDEDTRIREEFENEMSFNEVLDILKNDDCFKSAIKDIVTYIAWNREA